MYRKMVIVMLKERVKIKGKERLEHCLIVCGLLYMYLEMIYVSGHSELVVRHTFNLRPTRTRKFCIYRMSSCNITIHYCFLMVSFFFTYMFKKCISRNKKVSKTPIPSLKIESFLSAIAVHNNCFD